jgi:hypothetical protein
VERVLERVEALPEGEFRGLSGPLAGYPATRTGQPCGAESREETRAGRVFTGPRGHTASGLSPREGREAVTSTPPITLAAVPLSRHRLVTYGTIRTRVRHDGDRRSMTERLKREQVIWRLARRRGISRKLARLCYEQRRRLEIERMRRELGAFELYRLGLL